MKPEALQMSVQAWERERERERERGGRREGGRERLTLTHGLLSRPPTCSQQGGVGGGYSALIFTLKIHSLKFSSTVYLS